MQTRLNIIGIGAARASLRSFATRVPDGARKQMHKSADKIVAEAKLNAPVDVGNLERSIRILKDYQAGNGRLMIDIIAGAQEAISRGGTYMDVDQYAAIIHENYEQYTPGPRTLAKRAANPGRYIGSGFLTRAAADEEPKLQKQMIQTIETIIRSDR
jgi:uncharacterized protein YdaL